MAGTLDTKLTTSPRAPASDSLGTVSVSSPRSVKMLTRRTGRCRRTNARHLPSHAGSSHRDRVSCKSHRRGAAEGPVFQTGSIRIDCAGNCCVLDRRRPSLSACNYEATHKMFGGDLTILRTPAKVSQAEAVEPFGSSVYGWKADSDSLLALQLVSIRHCPVSSSAD